MSAWILLLASLAAGQLHEGRAAVANPFHLAVSVEDGEGVELAVLGSTLLVHNRGDELALAVADRRRVRRDPTLANGIASCVMRPAVFSGRSIHAAWLVRDLRAWSLCPDGTPHVWRRNGHAWELVTVIEGHQVLVAPWLRGSALAAVAPFSGGPPWRYELRVLGGPPDLVPPVPRRARHPTGGEDGCFTELANLDALVTGSDGSVLVLGAAGCARREDGDFAPAALEYFPPGARRGRVLGLPSQGQIDDMVHTGTSPRDFWVGLTLAGGRTRILHFDGSRLVSRAGPPGPLVAVGADRAQTLWAIAGQREQLVLWRASRGAPWTRVALPEGAGQPRALAVLPSGEAWVAAEHNLYTTAAIDDVLDWRWRECGEAEQKRAEADQAAEEAAAARWQTSARPCCSDPPPSHFGPEL